MTRAEANNLLDDARAGADVSWLQISAALRATGDLNRRRPLSRGERRFVVVAPRPVEHVQAASSFAALGVGRYIGEAA